MPLSAYLKREVVADAGDGVSEDKLGRPGMRVLLKSLCLHKMPGVSAFGSAAAGTIYRMECWATVPSCMSSCTMTRLT